MSNYVIKSDERAQYAAFRREQARFRSGRPRFVASSQTLMPAEDQMLQQIILLENSNDPNRSATVGMLIRAFFEMLVTTDQLAPGEIAPGEYEGWLKLWGIEQEAQPVEE